MRLYDMNHPQQRAQHLTALASRAEEERLAIWNERLHMTKSFCQLNRQLQEYGFLSQPSFICVQIGPLLPCKKERTDENIKCAAKPWCSKHRAVAEARYGHIRVWNTSLVTNMTDLLYGKRAFNDDLSGWDKSNVTTMQSISNSAHAFNEDLSRWDTSKVTTMFWDARGFYRDIHVWDIYNVTSMGNMFRDCPMPVHYKPPRCVENSQ